MGAMSSAMNWLGLSKDADAEYYEDDYMPPRGTEIEKPALSAVRREERETHMSPARQQMSQVIAPVDAVDEEQMQRIVTIHPRSYNDAQSIGDSFRNGIPVIVNLSEHEGNDTRIIDFCAGLTYALHGHLSRITADVMLLSPAAYLVDEERASTGSSFYNQN